MSIKGVFFKQGRVVLLENERSEWELPGGRLELGETPEQCVVREAEEELGIAVEVAALLDCWVYEVLPGRSVVIVTYGVRPCDEGQALRMSTEHRRLGLFDVTELEGLPMPEGYRRSIRLWART